MDQILLLIDNDCSDLNINQINEILNNNFKETHVSLNGKTIEKSLIANYIPVATSSSYLKLSDYSWSLVKQYSNVIFISEQYKPRKEICIFSLLYRILTSKSLILFLNNDFDSPFFSYSGSYPIFLDTYNLKTGARFDFPEVEQINDLDTYKTEIINEFKQYQFPDEEYDLDKIYKEFVKIYNYVLNGGRQWKGIVSNTGIKNSRQFFFLDNFLEQLENEFIHNDEYKFYDAQYTLFPSLGGKLQISIPGPGENKIFIFNTHAADYNFRNLKFKNVLVSTKQRDFFVLPFYKAEQTTRQTVRFLIMNLYNVFTNSVLIDFILLYLSMKVSLLDDTMAKTKYENVARLFLKRHGDLNKQKQFLKDNLLHLGKLKDFFLELKDFQDEELLDLFDEFITYDLKLLKFDFIKRLEVNAYEDSEIKMINENELNTFDIQNLCQLKQIQISNSNWPSNKNFKCNPSKLQLNSSSPFFICTPNYDEFMKQIGEIKWINTILKYTDKLVLKGGAIVDLMCQRKPKDYDFMNIGMKNDEFLNFMIKFCRDERPEKIEFVQNSIILFRVSLKNGDKIEFILNLNISRENLFCESYLPDQICYIPSEKSLIANEYTLWALNYGYSCLNMEMHPRAIRVSSKMNKLGFNFYFNYENESKFLKERLERYVWSLDIPKNIKTPSYAGTKETSLENNECIVSRGKIICDKKIIFSSRDEYLRYVKDLSETENKFELVMVKFDGGFILPDVKTDQLSLVNGIDWSF